MLTNRLTQESKAVNTLKETAKMTKAKYKVNSFFAGIGGFDLGFENQGFQTEYLCEINQHTYSLYTAGRTMSIYREYFGRHTKERKA